MTTTKTKLEELLEKIDPDNNINKISAEYDELFNSFPMDFGKIKGRDDFKLIISRFHFHMAGHNPKSIKSDPFRRYQYDKVVKNSDGYSYDISIELHYCEARDILKIEYQPGGCILAQEIARTGVNGGIYSVLKKIALHLQYQMTKAAINWEVYSYFDTISGSEIKSISEEYLSKYGHLLPEELTEDDGFKTHTNLREVLKEHPFIIKRMRDLG